MSLLHAFYDQAILMSGAQAVLVDAVTEDAPIIREMPVQDTTHGLQNVYPEINEVTGGQLLELDQELPSVRTDIKLRRTDVNIIGGRIDLGEDKSKLVGSKEEYLAMQLPAIARETGAGAESTLIYQSMLPYSLANGKTVSAGGSADTNYSIVCVTWTPGEYIGLIAPEIYDGKVFDIEWLHGGQLGDITDADGNTIVGYSARLKSALSLQQANPRYISAIQNIDLVNGNIPTEQALSQALTDARANPDRTVMYMHPDVATRLGTEYKFTTLQTRNEDRAVDTIVTRWNEAQIITSRNFLAGTEADVVV